MSAGRFICLFLNTHTFPPHATPHKARLKALVSLSRSSKRWLLPGDKEAGWTPPEVNTFGPDKVSALFPLSFFFFLHKLPISISYLDLGDGLYWKWLFSNVSLGIVFTQEKKSKHLRYVWNRISHWNRWKSSANSHSQAGL